MEKNKLFIETYEQLLREQTPNLMRLYLNPYVVQTCLCLERYVQTTWFAESTRAEPFQSFLANGSDEALGGAIKLARYCGRVSQKPVTGLMIDSAGRFGMFASSTSRGQRVEFLPGLVVSGKGQTIPQNQPFGFVVLASAVEEQHAEDIHRLVHGTSAILIRCVDRALLNDERARPRRAIPSNPRPDIVVFDESFVNRDVPFAAFTARKALFDHWNARGMTTFHSTTFQPNAISTLHFMRCLEQADPKFHSSIAAELRRIDADYEIRDQLFRRLYSRSLPRAIRITGFDSLNVRAQGDFVALNGRQVFDAVGGVACSVRGHNPPTYSEEMKSLANVDCATELVHRLRALTGLECMLPAVSGAGAVENALKIALVTQFPKRHVLALKSGFGGKTLLALTGTWSNFYKKNIDPLYNDVSYVDPFAPDALARIDDVFENHQVAVAQVELIQGVGGVRRVPEAVVRHLDAARAKHGCLLLIDEVQTGMFRTGPFTQSSAMGVVPDLLIVGKAISDMMFPFALTLHSEKVGQMLKEAGSNLSVQIREQFAYPFGYKTALNVLRFAERMRITEQVAAAARVFKERLGEELASCPAVRDVRVFGLLIGIELDASRRPQRWLRKRLYQIYISALLRHPRFPVLAGFCQSEPNVLKITPPLMIQPENIRQMCAVIGEALRCPFYRLVASAVGQMMNPFRHWGEKHESAVLQTDAAYGP